jgi:hypothetical protein
VAAGDRYRAKALELLARADGETDSQMRAEFENLAAAFIRLAEQADHNTKFVIEFLPPPENSRSLRKGSPKAGRSKNISGARRTVIAD